MTGATGLLKITMRYLKKARLSSAEEITRGRSVVEVMIAYMETRGEIGVSKNSKKFDGRTSASRISRVEAMEGHARACGWRLGKYFPDEDWSLEVYKQTATTESGDSPR